MVFTWRLVQYSRSYYRATWIATAFDAGFATAMNIRPKWFRNICEVVSSLALIQLRAEDDDMLTWRDVLPRAAL
jgi:hypothetical protein